MTSIQDKGFGESEAESIGQNIDSADESSGPPVKMGRPKQNPHAEDKKLTFRIPADLHRKLRYASVDLDKPMVEIAVDALIAYLANHEPYREAD